MQSYQVKVLGLCTSLLGHATQAEDAAQEIFIKAYRSLSSFRKDSTFSTWLYRIAANHCKDLLRKRLREKSESLEALTESDEVSGRSWEPSFDPRPAVETSRLVEALLASLSPDERLILTLREVQGLNYREISETLQCSVEAVKSRLRRAREALEKKSDTFQAGKASK